MSILALCVLAQAAPSPSFADRVSAEVEAGGGVQASNTSADAVNAAPSGKAQVGLTLGDRASGARAHLAARARNDTSGAGQVAAGAGVVVSSLDPLSPRLKLLAIGGVTEYVVLGSTVIPFAGAEATLAKAWGARRAFELSTTLGWAAVFPHGAGDTIDASTATISSYRRIGFDAWGRLAATFYVSPDLGIGLGPFVAGTLATLRHDVVSPFTASSTRPVDVAGVAGVQIVFAK